MSRIVAALVALSLAACSTTGADPNYVARLEAQASVERAQADVEKAKAAAEAARWAAVARVAETATDPGSRQLAIMALAIGANRVSDAPRQFQPMPALPVTDADRALQWAQVFAGPVTSIAAGYFGYRLGTTQSDNQASTTIAGYQTFGQIAGAGFASNSTLAGMIQAPAIPQPNITIGGSGVIGAGTYTGAYSGANAGNSGLIGNNNFSPPTTTTTTNTNTNTNTGNTTNTSTTPP
jgi:hypothetical protein